MKSILLAGVMLAAIGSTSAFSKVCGSSNGTGADAASFVFYNGSCSSDNQANDGDDLKAFLDKGGTATFLGPDIDFSLTKNVATAIDQNTVFKDLSATSSATGFTDGNGFANIKSVGDALQSWEVDPINGSILGRLGTLFPGFDGILFRGQFADLNGGSTSKSDTASFTLKVNLSDGTSVIDTFSGLKLTADDGVFGFDEIGTLPAGLKVTSVDAFTDAAHAWDQIKQVEFSVPGPVAAIPEPRTWAMMLIGFGLMAGLGYRRAWIARRAISSMG
jgi:hypothetical protein